MKDSGFRIAAAFKSAPTAIFKVFVILNPESCLLNDLQVKASS